MVDFPKRGSSYRASEADIYVLESCRLSPNPGIDHKALINVGLSGGVDALRRGSALRVRIGKYGPSQQ
jgi:hypothetical protein